MRTQALLHSFLHFTRHYTSPYSTNHISYYIRVVLYIAIQTGYDLFTSGTSRGSPFCIRSALENMPSRASEAASEKGGSHLLLLSSSESEGVESVGGDTASSSASSVRGVSPRRRCRGGAAYTIRGASWARLRCFSRTTAGGMARSTFTTSSSSRLGRLLYTEPRGISTLTAVAVASSRWKGYCACSVRGLNSTGIQPAKITSTMPFLVGSSPNGTQQKHRPI